MLTCLLLLVFHLPSCYLTPPFFFFPILTKHLVETDEEVVVVWIVRVMSMSTMSERVEMDVVVVVAVACMGTTRSLSLTMILAS